VLLAGRTDTGVHASGQVACFDLDWVHGLPDLVSALNANLPGDLAVRSAREAREDFQPRFDATSRVYRYRLFCEAVRDPLRERYAWRVWPKVGELRGLAEIWLGRHDFAAFGSPLRSGGSTVRTVHSARWHRVGNEWTFEVRADAFLYRMVRRLVFVQVAVGQGRLSAEALVSALRKPSKLLPGIAPASGLTLVEVCYDGQI
jgi:tRNA pseudouridine38-40 synthase